MEAYWLRLVQSAQIYTDNTISCKTSSLTADGSGSEETQTQNITMFFQHAPVLPAGEEELA